MFAMRWDLIRLSVKERGSFSNDVSHSPDEYRSAGIKSAGFGIAGFTSTAATSAFFKRDNGSFVLHLCKTPFEKEWECEPGAFNPRPFGLVLAWPGR